MAEIDYCTLGDVEAYSGVNFSDGIGPTDAEVAVMITNASRLIDAYAGRQLAGTESRTEFFDVWTDTEHFVLKYRPVVSVTNAYTVGDTGTLTALVQSRDRGTGDYWLADPDAGIIRLHGMFGGGIGAVIRQYVKVDYTAGETTPPAFAKMACIMLVARQCARAALNDENCMERIKEMWSRLLRDSEKEYKEYLDRVKALSLVDVATFGLKGAY